MSIPPIRQQPSKQKETEKRSDSHWHGRRVTIIGTIVDKIINLFRSLLGKPHKPTPPKATTSLQLLDILGKRRDEKKNSQTLQNQKGIDAAEKAISDIKMKFEVFARRQQKELLKKPKEEVRKIQEESHNLFKGLRKWDSLISMKEDIGKAKKEKETEIDQREGKLFNEAQKEFENRNKSEIEEKEGEIVRVYESIARARESLDSISSPQEKDDMQTHVNVQEVLLEDLKQEVESWRTNLIKKIKEEKVSQDSTLLNLKNEAVKLNNLESKRELLAKEIVKNKEQRINYIKGYILDKLCKKAIELSSPLEKRTFPNAYMNEQRKNWIEDFKNQFGELGFEIPDDEQLEKDFIWTEHNLNVPID